MPSPGRVVLHVGAMKTGTTYLQRVFFRNRAALADQGVLLPGANWPAQVHAVQDALRFGVHGYVPRDAEGAWERTVEQIHESPQRTALISMEFLCYADQQQATQIVKSLAPWDVEVVLTARDLQRTVPAAWQDRMRNAVDTTWQDFLASLREGDKDGPAASFWKEQDLGRILRRWEAAVGRDKVTVVTVPPHGAPRHELLHRFCRTIGVDADRLDPDVPPTNESIGLAAATLLQRLNSQAREVVPWPVYNRVVKNHLVTNVLSPTDASPRMTIGPEDHRWIREMAEDLVRSLAAPGYRVVGDLAELLPDEPLAPAPDPADISSEELLDLAIRGLVGLLRRYDEDVKVLVQRAERQRAVHEPGATHEGSVGLRPALDRASERFSLLKRTRRGIAGFRGRI